MRLRVIAQSVICASVVGACCFGLPGAAAADTPQYVPDAPFVDLVEADCLSPVRLLGFDVETAGTRGRMDVPEFKVGFETTLRVHLAPQVVPDADEPNLLVRVKGAGPEVAFTFLLSPTNWEPGVRTVETVTFKMPRFQHAGNGILTLAARCGDSGEAILYRGPSFTHQIVTTSSLPRAKLAQWFGDAIHPLRASFRLGAGSWVPVSVKEPVTRPVVGIGLVSTLAHSTAFKQGAPVAEVLVYGEDGSIQTLAVRAGVDTSLEEYDMPWPGTFHLKRTEIAASEPDPSGRDTWNEKPLLLHQYIARIPLETPVKPTLLGLQYRAGVGVIDISEIVLLFDDAALTLQAH